MRSWFIAPVILIALQGDAPAQEPAPPGGLVFLVGGVGGLENLKHATNWAVRNAKLDCEVREFNWTHGKGHILRDLQDTRHHEAKTAELVRLIVDAREQEPERPIYLIGRSGGSVLALTAAGQLPPETLERIILLSPAVSPSFDLRPALRACKHEIVNFHSDLDLFVLGWGTTQFGTADRFYTPSAGLAGFVKPGEGDDESRDLYRRLVQVRWTPSKILRGHPGGHIGTAIPTFLASDVTPWLKP